MGKKDLEKRLSEDWGAVRFDERQVLAKPPRKIESERSLLGEVSCVTDVMGTVDNSVWVKIAAVSR